MKQFNKAEAKLIFENYSMVACVAQDMNGEVYGSSDKPYPAPYVHDRWVAEINKNYIFINQYEEHPDGWENSLYSRADMED